MLSVCSLTLRTWNGLTGYKLAELELLMKSKQIYISLNNNLQNEEFIQYFQNKSIFCEVSITFVHLSLQFYIYLSLFR